MQVDFKNWVNKREKVQRQRAAAKNPNMYTHVGVWAWMKRVCLVKQNVRKRGKESEQARFGGKNNRNDHQVEE